MGGTDVDQSLVMQNMVHGLAALTSSGSLLETWTLKPHFRYTELESES